MEKVTDILLCEVETEDGRSLGRLFEVRSDGEPEHGVTNKDRPITELIYGATGLWEVLGLKKANFKSIPWKAVKKIELGKIIVDEEFSR
jgi:hypothetical protein